MKLSVVFTVLNQLKIDHWQTKSFAEHKALNGLSTITEGRGDLKNIQDDIEGEFNHLLYKLQQS